MTLSRTYTYLQIFCSVQEENPVMNNASKPPFKQYWQLWTSKCEKTCLTIKLGDRSMVSELTSNWCGAH